MEPLEPDPDAYLVALRDHIEAWLIAHGEFWDEAMELAASNTTLWAMQFLRLNEADIIAAEERIRLQGEQDFAERVRRSAADCLHMVPTEDVMTTTGRAFLVELDRLDHEQRKSNDSR